MGYNLASEYLLTGALLGKVMCCWLNVWRSPLFLTSFFLLCTKTGWLWSWGAHLANMGSLSCWTNTTGGWLLPELLFVSRKNEPLWVSATVNKGFMYSEPKIFLRDVLHMLKEFTRKSTHIFWIYLYEIPRIVKFIESKSKMVVPRPGERGREGWGVCD